MAFVSRLAGALLVEDDGCPYLVGETKRPIDWEAVGFHRPTELSTKTAEEGVRLPWIRLQSIEGFESTLRDVALSKHGSLQVPLAGEQLREELYARLIIQRNGSVSERLWDLILDSTDPKPGEVPTVSWLLETPAEIWDIVRDSVLKCS